MENGGNLRREGEPIDEERRSKTLAKRRESNDDPEHERKVRDYEARFRNDVRICRHL